ncbi:MAG TPA: recombinase A [Polyangiaceae bacterium]|nr:recombinase A [Polyangiaceae bacterium]
MLRASSSDLLASLRRFSSAFCAEAAEDQTSDVAAQEASGRAKALPLGLGKLDETLPEAGLPLGSVIEIATPRGLARGTTIALAACASAQAEARLRGGRATEGAFCAWVDAGASLFAPAVARTGVDLSRLLVVRPPPDAIARVAVRLAQSHAFKVIVVDTSGVPGSAIGERLDRWPTTVRRLALAVERSDCAVLLLTDSLAARSAPLPVAMRLEVERLSEDRVAVRVAKERRGRVSMPMPVELAKSA